MSYVACGIVGRFVWRSDRERGAITRPKWADFPKHDAPDRRGSKRCRQGWAAGGGADREEDFTVTEDGEPQSISFVEFQRIQPVNRAQTPPGQNSQPVVTVPAAKPTSLQASSTATR